MKDLQDRLQQFVTRMTNTAGSNLESVVLYGSAARDEFHAQYSDVNLLCVLRSVSTSELGKIAPVVRWWAEDEKQRPPLFLTAAELRDSADVFAVELLDIKQSHRVLFGVDPVANTEVPMNLHRVEVERELRTILLRLRHHFLLSAESEHLRSVLAKSFSSVSTLTRHALIAMGQTVPAGKQELLQRAVHVFGLKPDALDPIWKLREGKIDGSDLSLMYQNYMDAIATMLHALDHQVPKRQWKRSGGSS
jgi:predicted nucleotidyltransferase